MKQRVVKALLTLPSVISIADFTTSVTLQNSVVFFSTLLLNLTFTGWMNY